MSDYKPGTVAIATVRGVPNVRIVRSSDNDWISAEGKTDGWWVHRAQHVANIRPLVVLDPQDFPDIFPANPRDLRHTADQLEAERKPATPLLLRYLADQIEAQTTPPKPEPTKLGATHTDKQGRKWVLAAPSRVRPWFCEELAHNGWATWTEISA